MTWEIVREGTGSILAAEIRTCVGCKGGADCPIDVYLMKVRNAPSKMNLTQLAGEAELRDIKSGIHLVAEGQYVEGNCRQRGAKVTVVNTSYEKLGELNSH